MDCQLVVAGQDTSFLSYKQLRRDSIRLFRKDEDGHTYIFKDSDNKLFQANTNVRNYLFNNSDLANFLELDNEISEFIETIRKIYLKRKGL